MRRWRPLVRLLCSSLTEGNLPDSGDRSEVSFSGLPLEGAHVADTSRPSRRAVLATTAGLTAALSVPAPAAHATALAPPPDDRALRALIDRMTLEEKVGQLFVTRVYGHCATAPDQADV